MISRRFLASCLPTLMSFLVSPESMGQNLVSQKSVSCKLAQGEFRLNLALTPDNIESNKTAIFSGSYLGEFDAEASGYSDPKPQEKLYASIGRRAAQLRDVAGCLSVQGQSISFPPLEAARLEFEASSSMGWETIPSPKGDRKDLGPQNVFKLEIDQVEAHFQSGRWMRGMDSLRALTQLLATPLWKDRAGYDDLHAALASLTSRYLPDGIAGCHLGWQLALETSRQLQKGRILRHFVNGLCQDVNLSTTRDKLADIILLDVLLPSHLDASSEARLLVPEALLDPSQWQALMKAALQTTKAQRILFATREAAPLLASEGLTQREIIAALVQAELKFFNLDQFQKDLIVSRFMFYGTEGGI